MNERDKEGTRSAEISDETASYTDFTYSKKTPVYHTYKESLASHAPLFA